MSTRKPRPVRSHRDAEDKPARSHPQNNGEATRDEIDSFKASSKPAKNLELSGSAKNLEPSKPATAAAIATRKDAPRAKSKVANALPGKDVSAPPRPELSAADQEEHDSRGYLRTVPGWLASAVVHMVLLLLLALWTLKPPLELLPVGLVSSQVEKLEELEELIEPAIVETVELEELTDAAEIIDPGAADLGSVEMQAELAMAGPALSDLNAVADLGIELGDVGTGTADTGKGMGGTSFFGARARGRRFVFVVDNSNSMTKGRFETTMNELVRAVDGLTERESFYVVLFSDTAYPLFHPRPAKTLMPATYANKQKLRAWLRTVELCLRTQGKDAMELAISLRPDVIYILGDGAFTDNTTKLITSQPKPRFPIHTLGMEVKEKGSVRLKAIAKHTGGVYRDVAAHPAAVKMAKENPIKRNNARGPVWGLKLPKVAKKKKK